MRPIRLVEYADCISYTLFPNQHLADKIDRYLRARPNHLWPLSDKWRSQPIREQQSQRSRSLEPHHVGYFGMVYQ